MKKKNGLKMNLLAGNIEFSGSESYSFMILIVIIVFLFWIIMALILNYWILPAATLGKLSSFNLFDFIDSFKKSKFP